MGITSMGCKLRENKIRTLKIAGILQETTKQSRNRPFLFSLWKVTLTPMYPVVWTEVSLYNFNWMINSFQEIPPLQSEKHGFSVGMTSVWWVSAAGSTWHFFQTRAFMPACAKATEDRPAASSLLVVSSRLREPTSIKITVGRRSERMEGSHWYRLS